MFWSYLWGIEISPCWMIYAIAYSRFDLTYEGLKSKYNPNARKWRKKFWSYLWGIEMYPPFPSYNFWDLFWSYLWGIEIVAAHGWSTRTHFGFDLTYEGLKYVIYSCFRFTQFVLILPMRDWNYAFSKSVINWASVLILPMRDWNLLMSR